MKGSLIVFCGIDGSGKTTQQQMLVQRMAEKDMPVLATRQPTDFYRKDTRVRPFLDHGDVKDMKILALLSAADRRWHQAHEILPALEKGIHVVCDRYIYSALAYFSVRGLDPSYIWSINEPIIPPDALFFLDVEPSLARRRVSSRDGAIIKYEEQDESRLDKIREAFYRVLPDRATILDGTTPPEVLHQQIAQRIFKE